MNIISTFRRIYFPCFVGHHVEYSVTRVIIRIKQMVKENCSTAPYIGRMKWQPALRHFCLALSSACASAQIAFGFPDEVGIDLYFKLRFLVPKLSSNTGTHPRRLVLLPVSLTSNKTLFVHLFFSFVCLFVHLFIGSAGHLLRVLHILSKHSITELHSLPI